MARRLFLSDERVQHLVERLVPLFAAAGSINRLCDLLNEAMGAEDRKGLYPNRLHTILSEKPNRSLNEASVGAIEKAVTALIEAEPDFLATGTRNVRILFERVKAAWPKVKGAADPVAEVAQAVDVPPAVAAAALRDFALDRPVAPREMLVVAPPQGHARLPDWSFQDVACQRCLDALRRGPGRKAGLVVPTGGGKTRIALRVALKVLEQYPTGRVIWITHLKNLRTQARRQLQKMLTEEPQALPPNAALLIERIDFMMVSRLAEALADPAAAPLLVIVDEGHHAAAESYQPLLRVPYPVRGLFLTATPNRTDDLPIGIDEIAFTITYKELAERGVILMPTFRPFAVLNFDWSSDALNDLADDLLENAEEDYAKTLVICPSIAKVGALHQALLDRLGERPGHILTPDDIAFVHSERVSHGESAEECLSYFADKPRGILVSAQMLLEGHDDPTINAVVVTYRTESLIKLMQAAGRCVRYSPGKTRAFVVYATDRELQYRFDHRWLYQEIDDWLLPELIDIDYTSREDMLARLEELLDRHNVQQVVRERVIQEAAVLTPGDRFRVLLAGLPYFGPLKEFVEQATWSAISETPTNTAEFRQIFNEYCRLGASFSSPREFLLHHGRTYGLQEEQAPYSRWRLYHDMLAAMYHAQGEVYGDGSKSALGQHRPYRPDRATTWLKYVTFHYRPGLPAELEAFLADCFNREAVAADWLEASRNKAVIVKLPLPLGLCEAILLSGEAASAFCAACEAARTVLIGVPPQDQIGAFTTWRAQQPTLALLWRLMEKLDRYLPQAEFDRLVFSSTPAAELA